MSHYVIKRYSALPLALWLSFALTGCYLGQTGPLYLPKEETAEQAPSEQAGRPAASDQTTPPEQPPAKAPPRQ